jgi:hypothetical protein
MGRWNGRLEASRINHPTYKLGYLVLPITMPSEYEAGVSFRGRRKTFLSSLSV